MLPVIDQPFEHAMMPIPDHDCHAREDFIVNLKLYLSDFVYPFDELVYEKRVKPLFVKENKREPKDCDEVHKLMMKDNFTQFWSCIARNMQEMLWDNQIEIAEKNQQRMEKYSSEIKKTFIGSLSLNPEFKTPKYIESIDIHAMPGGYQTTLGDNDIISGAVYDRGAYYYTKGYAGRWGEGGGTAILDTIKSYYPKFSPKRILDVGCAIGWTSTPFADAYPEAEIFAIDVGASILRYGHARANSLGKKINFLQQSGEHIEFPDCHFDLVISGGVFHETSKKGAVNMIKEMYRVLKSNGICMNYDIPYGGDYSLHSQFMLNWDSYYNAEPFWRQWTSMERSEFMEMGGFKKSSVIDVWADRDHEGNFKLFDHPFDDIHTNAKGGIGRVQFFGAQRN